MDAIERIEKASAHAQKVIEGISAEDMGKPTPCSEYDVRELLNHVIAGLSMLDTAASGGKAAPPEGNIVGDDPGAQYREGREKLLDTLRTREGVLDQNWEMPFGSLPGQMMAGIAFMEHLTHAWDLAKATGQDTELPEDLAVECLELVRPMDAMLRMPGVCGPAVEVPEGASVSDQLAGFMGRTP